MALCGTGQERLLCRELTDKKRLLVNLDKSKLCSLMCSCCIAWEHNVCDIKLSEDPKSSGLLSACMRAEHFALQLQSSGWHILLATLLAQDTTKSHNYLDCIIGPPTHAVCPKYCNWDVNTSQTTELVHCGTVWVITNRSTGVGCMFTVCVSQQHRWSDLLLAVMVAEGGERTVSHCSCTCRIQTHQASFRSHWSDPGK